MEEKKIYIVLTDTGTLLTRLIKLYTKKPYNHASISFDAYLTEVYSFGRKRPHNPFIGGFVKENVRSYFFEQAGCAIYSLEVTEADRAKMKHYINDIEAEKDVYRYNFLGLFGFLFNKPLKREKAFFCSQFAATVLNQCEGVSFDKSFALITPNDLIHIKNLTLEYEGKMEQYTSQTEVIEMQVTLQNMVQYF